MSAPEALYLPARAKLNLVLRVVGRRADGYHLLDTVFHTLALHDDVTVERGDGPDHITVTADRDALLVPADGSNLAMRALDLFRRDLQQRGATTTLGGLHIRIHKRIPNGGGLGGGSSNAAAVLRLANRLAAQPLDHPALLQVAAPLGADVPFFLRGGSQRGRGVGDELTDVEVPSRHFVLLVPPYGCNTAAVYKNHAALWRDSHGVDTVHPITVVKNRDSAVGNRYCNELEAAAEQLQPELGQLRRAVVAAGCAEVRMSGSGSTLFVACDTADEAKHTAHDLAQCLAGGPHQEVGFVVTCSGPAVDFDQPC